MAMVPKTAERATLFLGIVTCGLVMLFSHRHFGAVFAPGNEQTREVRFILLTGWRGGAATGGEDLARICSLWQSNAAVLWIR